MRAVVFAYSNIGDRCLRVLRARGVDVPLVVTHRDDPREKLWFRRVSETAADLGLDTVSEDDPRDVRLHARVAAAAPDVIFAFYYRRMLPAALLALAPRGGYNMHGSLLPKYRGRAPTNWAVLMGETETGATLHEMVEKPDAGAIVDQQRGADPARRHRAGGLRQGDGCRRAGALAQPSGADRGAGTAPSERSSRKAVTSARARPRTGASTGPGPRCASTT